MTALPELALIVLNWNNATDTIACLSSLAQSTHPLRLIVVDNGSSDDSVSRIKSCGVAHTLLENPENLGYAGGNNVGLRHALELNHGYIGVLNNDTIAFPDTWERLLRHLTSTDPATAVSPRIVYPETPQRAWFEGGQFRRGSALHVPRSSWETARQPYASEVLTGCCIVAPASVWSRVGLFDEGMFLIYEDTDWSLRARKAGVQLTVDPTATLVHKVSKTFEKESLGRIGSFYHTRNGLEVNLRHTPQHLPRFAAQWIARRVLRNLRSGHFPGDADCVLLGAGAFLFRHRGKAPDFVRRRAGRDGVRAGQRVDRAG